MMLHVARDPALWDEIVEEATSQPEPATSPKDLELFPKAEALFRECLRLYPPIHLLPPRRVVEPIEIHGFTIPPQTRVSASLFSLSMDPEEYPEPEKIRLDRWTELGRQAAGARSQSDQ
jgi:cytochrome P450 monooxygenase